MSSRLIWLSLSVAAITSMCLRPAWATWEPTGTSVCSATGSQSRPVAVSDGAGGSIIAWIDQRGGAPQLYALRIDVCGVPASGWQVNGKPITDASSLSESKGFAMVSDRAGGAIVGWMESNMVRAQRVGPSGSLLWGSNGSQISALLNPVDLVIAADPSQGAYFAFESNGRIVSQHVDQNGNFTTNSSNGHYVTLTPSQDQVDPDIICIGSASGHYGIIAWSDYRDNDWEIYGQKFAGWAGPRLWAEEGKTLASYYGKQWRPSLVWDGYYGFYCVWEDYSRLGSIADIYGGKFDSQGTLDGFWGPYRGKLISQSSANAPQSDPYVVVHTDLTPTFIWKRIAITGKELYAQRLGGQGGVYPGWSENGKVVSSSEGNKDDLKVLPDGTGGFVATWRDGHSDGNILAIRFLGSGGKHEDWPVNGQMICSATGHQASPTISTSGASGYFIAWQDAREGGANLDVYAQHVTSVGGLGTGDGLTLTSLNGGVSVSAGCPITITWTSTGSCVTAVTLEYSVDGGGAWNLIVADTPNDGSHVWNAPATPTSQLRVRVSAGFASDASDADNTVAGGLTLNQPNDGQTLVPGKASAITWQSTGCFSTVDLHYSTDNGVTWIAIALGTPNDWFHIWTVPNTPTTQGLVRVSVGGVGDVSDQPFRIEPHPTGWIADGIPLKFPPGEVAHAVTVPAPSGGAFVVWRKRTGAEPGIYMGRVTATGTFPNGWSYGGKRIAVVGAGGSLPHQVVPDGNGGLYVGFESDGAAVLQHVTGAGSIGDWPEDGVLLHSSGGSPRLAPDGTGGVYAAWYGGGVRVTRLTSAGEPAAGWANGVDLNRTSTSVDVASGGTAGGVYVVADGFVTRIEANGEFAGPWAASGFEIQYATGLQAIPDGQNGVIAAFRIGTTSELRMTRRASDSSVPTGWLAEGTLIESDVWAFPGYHHYDLAADGAGGALVAYATFDQLLMVQRVLPSGNFALGWGSNGVHLSTHASLNKAAPTVVSDGWQGAIVTWQEDRDCSSGCDWDIYAHHVLATGVLDPTFTANGKVVTGLPTMQRWPSIALTGLTKAIAGWQDSRPTSGPCTNCEQSIYAQEVSLDLLPAPTLDLVATPNPNGALLNWTASGEDATIGTAQTIDIRFSLNTPVTESNFGNCQSFPYVTPLSAGSLQCVEIGELGGGARYFFALKTIDQWGHPSLMSNVAEVVTKQGGSMTLCEDPIANPADRGAAGDGVAPIAAGLHSLVPNPATTEVRLRYAAPADERRSPYDLSVYDMAGRRLQVIDQGPSLELHGDRVWRPREDGRLEPGVYYLRFRAGDFVQTRSLVVLGRR